MKYLVTDPCYLLDLDAVNRDSIWNKCIDDMFNSDHSDKYDGTNYTGAQKILSEELGINVIRVSDTGFGDWSNSISSFSKHIKILSPEFFADVGLMCVVEINEKLENFLENHSIGAIFESDEPIAVDVDSTDENWYVLKITDVGGLHDYATSVECANDWIE